MPCFIGILLFPLFAFGDALDQWMIRTSSVPITVSDLAYGRGLFRPPWARVVNPANRLSSSSGKWHQLEPLCPAAPTLPPTAVTPWQQRAFGRRGDGLIFTMARRTPGVHRLNQPAPTGPSFPRLAIRSRPTNIYAVTHGQQSVHRRGPSTELWPLPSDGTNWTNSPHPHAVSAHRHRVWQWPVGSRSVPRIRRVDRPSAAMARCSPPPTAPTGCSKTPPFNALRVLLRPRPVHPPSPETPSRPTCSPCVIPSTARNWVNIVEPAIHIIRKRHLWRGARLRRGGRRPQSRPSAGRHQLGAPQFHRHQPPPRRGLWHQHLRGRRRRHSSIRGHPPHPAPGL